MMAELYALPHAKDAYERAMRELEERDQANAVKVVTAMACVARGRRAARRRGGEGEGGGGL